LSGRAEGRLLLEFGGEFFDVDKVSGLTGGATVSATARLCPRASWRGCFLAAVRGLGQGRFARSEVAAMPLMVSA
jgi:hypothetical protein